MLDEIKAAGLDPEKEADMVEKAKQLWEKEAMTRLTYLPTDSFRIQVEKANLSEDEVQRLIEMSAANAD
jgi:hypothetical protein